MIKLSDVYVRMREGIQVVKCTKVNVDKQRGIVELTLKNKENEMHTERFALYKIVDGKAVSNDPAFYSFSFLARTLMGDNSIDEIEEEELVGKYAKVMIVHDVQNNINKPGETITFTRIDKKAFPPEHATGFGVIDKSVNDAPQQTQDVINSLFR